jgi:hypothetical protein
MSNRHDEEDMNVQGLKNDSCQFHKIFCHFVHICKDFKHFLGPQSNNGKQASTY